MLFIDSLCRKYSSLSSTVIIGLFVVSSWSRATGNSYTITDRTYDDVLIFTQYFKKEKIIASTPSDSPHTPPQSVCECDCLLDCYEDVVSRNKILVISVLDLIYWSQVMNIYRCLCLCLFTQYMPANRKISIRIPDVSID